MNNSGEFDSDDIALYIDNCEPTLNRILDVVKQADESGKDQIDAVKQYIVNNVVNDMKTYGDVTDRQNSRVIRKIIPTVTLKDWQELCEHYVTKYNENRRRLK